MRTCIHLSLIIAALATCSHELEEAPIPPLPDMVVEPPVAVLVIGDELTFELVAAEDRAPINREDFEWPGAYVSADEEVATVDAGMVEARTVVTTARSHRCTGRRVDVGRAAGSLIERNGR